MEWLTDLWHRLYDPKPYPPGILVLVTVALAAIVVFTPGVWRIARTAITIAHEGGHALLAVLTGRRLRGIRLHTDTSGLTLSAGRPTGPGMVFTLLAGYITPSLLGLAGAAALTAGRITLMLWLALILLLAMLIMVRNGYGVLALLATIAIVFAVSWFTGPRVQAAFAYSAVWFLLLGGVKPIGELQTLRRRGRMRDSDPDQLAGITHVPAGLWITLFALVNLVSLVLGAIWLLDAAGYQLPDIPL